jgi:UDP-N-acetylmuramate dehydrogenase
VILAKVTKIEFFSVVFSIDLLLTGNRTSMQLRENISLKSYNTFGIDVTASRFAEVTSKSEVLSFFRNPEKVTDPLLILGRGSNVLFTKNFPGTILKISTKGIQQVSEDNDQVFVRASAGENWDDLVRFCVEKGWGGLENLSLIPGNAGTSPVQNVGAYGVEVRDTLYELTAFDIASREERIFTKEECEFGYRDSIFKSHYKGRFIILDVTFRLRKQPVLSLDYGNIREELSVLKVGTPTIRDVRTAVCNIRQRKLPDPAILGNAGSFFKNPVISARQFQSLQATFPNIVSFPQDGMIKLAAAWMIESCGWKGKRTGNAGIHELQPLVIVNYGNATGSEIFHLGCEIQQSVYEKFGVLLETEVNVI